MLHPRDDRSHWLAFYNDAAAEPFDHARVGYTSAANSRLMHAAVRRAIGSTSGLRILDAGCGDGQVTAPIAATNQVIGADFARPMASRAKARGLVPVCTDLTALPFRPQSFDLVLCVEAMQHLADPLVALAGMVDVVKPGGRLVISALNRRSLLRHVVRTASLVRKTFEPRLMSPMRCEEVLSAGGLDVEPVWWVAYVFGFVVQPRGRLVSWLLSWVATNFILIAHKPELGAGVLKTAERQR